MGNLLVQVQADGGIGSLKEIREIAGKSTEAASYEPREGRAWNQAFDRMRSLIGTANRAHGRESPEDKQSVW